MENASKALIIAAEVLFGVILLSIFVLGYQYWSNLSNTINENVEQTNINEFNNKFLIYNEKSDVTVYDVVSILNLANDYNQDNVYKITIKPESYGNISNIAKFIEDNQEQKYKINIKLDEKTQRVDTITITKQ